VVRSSPLLARCAQQNGPSSLISSCARGTRQAELIVYRNCGRCSSEAHTRELIQAALVVLTLVRVGLGAPGSAAGDIACRLGTNPGPLEERINRQSTGAHLGAIRVYHFLLEEFSGSPLPRQEC
jgi:hypothetical protein